MILWRNEQTSRELLLVPYTGSGDMRECVEVALKKAG